MGFSIYLGPYQPFLEQSLFDEVKELRLKDPLTPLVVLVPNRLLVRHLREVLARAHGQVFNIRFLTFHQYLLEATEGKWIQEGFRMLPESLVPWVLRETARGLKPALRSFKAVEDTPGFHKTLQATLSELRQASIDPADLKGSSRKIGKDKTRKRLSEKWDEFSRVLAAYEAWKNREKWKDREDLYVDVLTLPPPETPLWTYGFYDAPALQKKVLLHLTAKTEIATSPNAPIGAAPRNDNKMENYRFIPYEDHPAFEYAKPFVEWVKENGTVKGVGKYESLKATPLGRLQNDLFITKQSQGTPHPDPLPQGARVAGSPSPLRGEGRDEGDGSMRFEDSDLKVLLCPGGA